MNTEHPFLDNAVAFDSFNDKENQLLKQIDKNRKKTSASTFSYRHKDGTNVIFAEHNGSNDGLDIILVRGDDYVHFATGKGDVHKNGQLDVSIGSFNNGSSSQHASYPMKNYLADREIVDIMGKECPKLENAFNKYMPEDFQNMKTALNEVAMLQGTSKNALFMNAFNKWNEGY